MTDKYEGHTPGPWRFDDDWNRVPTIFGPDGIQKIATIEKHDARIRTVGPWRNLPGREANAALIAAAPETADALKAVTAERDALREALESARKTLNAYGAMLAVAEIDAALATKGAES